MASPYQLLQPPFLSLLLQEGDLPSRRFVGSGPFWWPGQSPAFGPPGLPCASVSLSRGLHTSSFSAWRAGAPFCSPRIGAIQGALRSSRPAPSKWMKEGWPTCEETHLCLSASLCTGLPAFGLVSDPLVCFGFMSHPQTSWDPLVGPTNCPNPQFGRRCLTAMHGDHRWLQKAPGGLPGGGR